MVPKGDSTATAKGKISAELFGGSVCLYLLCTTKHFSIIIIMKEQEIKETLSDIKDLMERSQKVMFLNGTSGIVVAVWAFLGAMAVSFVLTGSLNPIQRAWNPIHKLDIGTIAIVASICTVVFCASFLTVWLMSKQRAKRMGIDFTLDTGARRLLNSFFTIMVVGGLVCLTSLFNELYILIPDFMLLFYGLALVVISPIAYKISVTKYIGYAEILLGIAALAIPSLGFFFWIIGFCGVNLIWGVWFHFVFERKER